MSGLEGLGRGEQAGSDFAPGSDDEVRAIFVRLITFVAAAKASYDMKNDALQCIEVLQARLARRPTDAQMRCLLHIREHGVSGATGARRVLYRCVLYGWVRVVGKPPRCRSLLTAAGSREVARYSGASQGGK